MTEAEKYTVEMWQHHLGQVINLVLGTEKRRRAFIDGFNGLTVDEVHYTGRSAWERGRQSAVLLGYIPASGIEAASADETRSGSAEGESPTAEGRDVQGSDLSRLTPSKE